MHKRSVSGQQVLNSQKFPLPVSDGYELAEISDIVRCEADGNYTRIYLISREKMLITRTLKELETALAPHGFLRVHHHHLVNLRHATKYTRGKGGQLTLTSGTVVNVSHRCKKKLMQALAW